ncbi:MAG: hypothetical protein Q8R31_06785, partial [Candidatus Omnitrophota bacterium]|nr:hypothetical protein [Candidatus Omnitrophota bacterium]
MEEKMEPTRAINYRVPKGGILKPPSSLALKGGVFERRSIKFQEKEHGKKIQDRADEIWGWSSPAGILRANRRLKEFLPYL